MRCGHDDSTLVELTGDQLPVGVGGLLQGEGGDLGPEHASGAEVENLDQLGPTAVAGRSEEDLAAVGSQRDLLPRYLGEQLCWGACCARTALCSARWCGFVPPLSRIVGRSVLVGAVFGASA